MEKHILIKRNIIKAIVMFVFFIAIFMFKPLQAYADDDVSIGQMMNLSSYSSNETDESSNEQASYLYWAASGERSGIMLYVVNEKGLTMGKAILMEKSGRDKYGDYIKMGLNQKAGIKGARHLNPKTLVTLGGIGTCKYVQGVTPVTYTGGWQATGSQSMAYLMQDSGQSLIFSNGYKMPLPNWALYVLQTGAGGAKAIKALAKPDTKWRAVVEPVSINYMYSNNTFKNDTVDATGMTWHAGDPMPDGATNSNYWQPRVHFGTAYQLISESNRVGGQGGGQYTYKFYNTQLPYSLCLERDLEITAFGGGSKIVYPAVNSKVHRIGDYTEIRDDGVALAAIDITGFSLPPIHTYGGSTPGNTENPDPPKDGKCTIKKLYYTEVLNPDGTIAEAEKDKHKFSRSKTTNYISVDNESGYVLEGWKASSKSHSLNSKRDFKSIGLVTQQGTSSSVITIGEKDNLYVLLKKTVIKPTPPKSWDFQIQESQISKRVTFLESAKTSVLSTHQFKWAAGKVTNTACTKHGGYGHVLNCNQQYDRIYVPHVHSWVDSNNHDKSAYDKNGCPYKTCTKDYDRKPTKRDPGVPHNHAANGEQFYYRDSLCAGPGKCKNKQHLRTGVHHTAHTDDCKVYVVPNCTKTQDPKDIPHTHVNSCYTSPCSDFKWMDNTIKLGVWPDTTKFNKAVISDKHIAVTINNLTANTVSGTSSYRTVKIDNARTGTGESTQLVSNVNAIVLLFRGQDHLTLADWKNTSTNAKSYLGSMSSDGSYNFRSSNNSIQSRKAGAEYDESFSVTVSNNGNPSVTDLATRFGPGKAASNGLRCPSSTSNFKFKTDTALTISNINVNIKVFWANGSDPGSSASSPSGSLRAGEINNFYPYIRMRYDNDSSKNVNAYVLSQFKRSATFYDYATVSLDSSRPKHLNINSSQWTTHVKAQNSIVQAFGSLTASDKERVQSSILPGGATLSVATNRGESKKVTVTTYQAFLTGNGQTQINNTGGSTTLPTNSGSLKSSHDAFASSVASGLQRGYIAEFATQGVKKSASEITSGRAPIRGGQKFGSNTLSTDAKYHFNNYADSRFNTDVQTLAPKYYTFFVNTSGEVRAVSGQSADGKSNAGVLIAAKGSDTVTGSGAAATVAKKTGVVAQLRKALIDNEGNDKEASWASGDGKWYNEAFDGVTYMVNTTVINVGLWDPMERSTVLDPMQTQSQSSTEDFFNKDKYNSSVFSSYVDGGPVVTVGTFTNSAGSSKTFSMDFSKLFVSDVFYIPNVTTQDLK